MFVSFKLFSPNFNIVYVVVVAVAVVHVVVAAVVVVAAAAAVVSVEDLKSKLGRQRR